MTLGYFQSKSLQGVQRVRVWELLFLPVKDVVFLGLWTFSLGGKRVRWGDEDILIDSQGRITREM